MFHKFSIKKRRYSVPFGKRIPSFLCYTKSISRILNQSTFLVRLDFRVGNRKFVQVAIQSISLQFNLWVIHLQVIDQLVGTHQCVDTKFLHTQFARTFVQYQFDVDITGRYRSSMCTPTNDIDILGGSSNHLCSCKPQHATNKFQTDA